MELNPYSGQIYTIAVGKSPGELIEKVKELHNQGWLVHEGLVSFKDELCQAMLKYAEV